MTKMDLGLYITNSSEKSLPFTLRQASLTKSFHQCPLQELWTENLCYCNSKINSCRVGGGEMKMVEVIKMD